MSGSGISGVTGAGDGEEKQLASGYLVNVHTAPDKSVRLRVALYFVNIFSRRNRGICAGSLTMAVCFYPSGLEGSQRVLKGAEFL